MSNSTPTPFLLLNEDDIEWHEFEGSDSFWQGMTIECHDQSYEQLKQQILSGLKLIRLVVEDIHIYEHSVCILDEGGECVNCNAKELLEALLEESRKK